MNNSIWEIKGAKGKKVTGFNKIVDASKSFFLFKEPRRCPIIEILKVINLFPSYISAEINNSLQEEISEK